MNRARAADVRFRRSWLANRPTCPDCSGEVVHRLDLIMDGRVVIGGSGVRATFLSL
ncbi:hypothetical protein [Pseudonocardia kunmingensis]|uniref:hypothetical protein n=1 Tax=Pseudonocardia kunmingensis TaxID=630975 RepID=UPI001B881B6A|nr:hypothetical protein [Pseudonocardia kunmingensis]